MMPEYNNSVVNLVDDDPAILDSLTMLLKPMGLQIASFESATDFLNSYCSAQPGCLVLDVKMPRMGGLELQNELSKRNINIPIIFISGNAGISDAAKAFKGGAIDFLEKPFNPNQLVENILKAIEKDILNRNDRIEQENIKELFNSLTAREKEVLQLIVSNHSSKQAAKKLDVSHRTIEAHRARIMEKMHADSTTKLVALTVKHGLL